MLFFLLTFVHLVGTRDQRFFWIQTSDPHNARQFSFGKNSMKLYSPLFFQVVISFYAILMRFIIYFFKLALLPHLYFVLPEFYLLTLVNQPQPLCLLTRFLIKSP